MRRTRALICLVLLASGASIVSWTGVRINLTSSIPSGLYRERHVISGDLHRGEVVLACLPLQVATLGRERGYLPRGPCPGGAMTVGKLILALPGDTVLVEDDGLSVNGVRVAESRPLRADHRGRPLPQLARAAYSVRSGELWVGSRSVLGFDSRYFGSVPSTSVLAELHALYVVSP